MHQATNDSYPIPCGHKLLDWKPLQKRMQERLGDVLSLSQKLTREELVKLGFKAAANGLYPTFQGGYDGRTRPDYSEERLPFSRG